MLTKQTILKIKNVYTANAFQTTEGYFIGAGSETEPDVQLYDLANEKAETVGDCPGGMMSFIPVPDHPDSFVTIMGLFPPFKGKTAGIYLHQKSGSDWKTVKALELPFAHRCEFISHRGNHCLIAAAVSKYKEDPADWSRPGIVQVVSLGDGPEPAWQSEIIDTGITRNHGMTKTEINGHETICVSGAEGIFSIVPGQEDQWNVNSIFEKEVSEMTFIDLDGDGNREMVTVEPFHGNTLNIYKYSGSGWELRFSDSLSFGHGLSSGVFNSTPTIVVGSRRGSFALETITVSDLAKGAVTRKVIEEDAGPTQTQVFSYGSVDYIMSANQGKNEVALYTGNIV
jgi:hypothetical protein